MLVLMCTRLGDRRTRLGDRRQHLGYCLGMRAQQLLSRRGFAAANISACCGWAAATISPCAPAATIPAGEGRGYHLGRAGSWLLSWQGSAAATTTVSRQGGAAPRPISAQAAAGWLPGCGYHASGRAPRPATISATTSAWAAATQLVSRLAYRLGSTCSLSARLDFAARLGCGNGTSRLRPDSATAWQGPAASKRANKAVTAQQAQRGASAGTGAHLGSARRRHPRWLTTCMTQQSSMPQLCAAKYTAWARPRPARLGSIEPACSADAQQAAQQASVGQLGLIRPGQTTTKSGLVVE